MSLLLAEKIVRNKDISLIFQIAPRHVRLSCDIADKISMNGQTDTCVREMVRHVIQNMEDFQQSLDSMVKDLQCLIQDIDTVTTDIQERVDRKSIKRCNHPSDLGCPRRENAVRKLLDSVRIVDESPDLDLSYLQITSSYQRPKWGRSLSFPVSSFKLSTLVNPKEEFREEYNATSYVCDIYNVEEHSRHVPNLRTTRCTAQLKASAKIKIIPEFKSSLSTIDKHSSASSSSGTYKEIRSIKRSMSLFETSSHNMVLGPRMMENSGRNHPMITDSVVENIPQNMVEATTQTSFGMDRFDSSTADVNCDVFCNVPEPPYMGSYEREMETELENLFEFHQQFRDPDIDDWVMDTGNSTTLSDDDIEFDKEVNSLVSFTLSNTVKSSQSSESSFSASESDIINHNTQATTMYGNLIFSDNLVILPNESREVTKRFDV